MDVIITAVGEFVWAASCAAVNFCLGSGLSVLVVFISLLSIILASALYKFMSNQSDTVSNKVHDEEDLSVNCAVTETLIEPPEIQVETIEKNDCNNVTSITEIEISLTENQNEEKTDQMIIDRIEGSEEEIQKQQIANIYRLLNDQNLINNWSSTDFLDQLKMYGLQGYDENEFDSSENLTESDPLDLTN